MKSVVWQKWRFKGHRAEDGHGKAFGNTGNLLPRYVVELRGQLSGVSSVFSLCESWAMNSSHLAWWWAPLPNEPFHWLLPFIFFSVREINIFSMTGSWNLGPHTCQVSALPLSCSSCPFLVYFLCWNRVSLSYSCWLQSHYGTHWALKIGSSSFSLLSVRIAGLSHLVTKYSNNKIF